MTEKSQGIVRNDRGEEQPADKDRAQKAPTTGAEQTKDKTPAAPEDDR